jgi:hypothetical protein
MCRKGTMKATKIKMKPGCGRSNNLLELESVYIIGCDNPGYFSKATLHNYLEKNPGTIQVNISPYPNVIPATSPSPYFEKYVKSTPDSTTRDNLLSLPRE